MGLKQDIMIKSKFGTKTAGRYILRYTSREDATESLDLNEYITKYTTRYGAVESLKDEAPTTEMIEETDLNLKRKNGILFGNRGLSYTDEELKHAASVTQKACEQGHVAILPIVSFSHQYLVDKGIVPEDMKEPKKAGLYKGQVDQLKLRLGISKMMDKMHHDMGFTEPEWTGSIQFDTKHVHVHLTTVETGVPDPKRMKRVKKEIPEKVPDMNWLSQKKDSYTTNINDKGLVEYLDSNGDQLAIQRVSQKGNPKWTIEKNVKGTELVEKGKIPAKVFDRMRDSLNRELSKTKDIKPFVKDIQQNRDMTKNLTMNAINYTDVTVERLQALKIALPSDKTLWRASSKSKEMQRPRELADNIVDDLWTRQRNAVGIPEFELSVDRYIMARDDDEELSDDVKLELKENAYLRLRAETINQLYETVGNMDDKKLTVEIPRQSIKAASTEVLKNEIAQSFNREPEVYDDIVQFEYRNRSYIDRFSESVTEAKRYQKEIARYDILKNAGLTVDASKVMRDHYYEEYKYNAAVADKYAYLTTGGSGHVTQERFNEVKGIDLHNMVYDFKSNADRTVPNGIIQSYEDVSKSRMNATNNAIRYLSETDQYDVLPVYQNMRRERMVEIKNAQHLKKSGSLPLPKMVSDDMLQKGLTFNMSEGNALLRNELVNSKKITDTIADDYLLKVPTLEKRTRPVEKSDTDDIDWTAVTRKDRLTDMHIQEERLWALQRLQFDAYMREQERKVKEQELIEADKKQRDLEDKSKEIKSVEPPKDVDMKARRKVKKNIFKKE